MKLLPPELLVKTGPVDHADWNFRPFLGLVSRTRFRLARHMLGEARFHRLLEVGYGSGVLMPELALHTKELYGVDVHCQANVVSEKLEKANIHAELYNAPVTSLPFPDRYFDCIVGVSVFEFVDDLETACNEIERVLSDRGFLLVVTPNDSPILDAGLRLLTRESAKKDFGDRRKKVMPALCRRFTLVEERPAPWAHASMLKLYTGLKLARHISPHTSTAAESHPAGPLRQAS
jgi:ubiquinone/menaquinone biosynthesis C-methylase UbiE